MSTTAPRDLSLSRPNHYLPLLVILTFHPGRWAVIAEDTTNGTIVRWRDVWGQKGFEFVGRGSHKNGQLDSIYARYIGSPATTPFPEPNWQEPSPARNAHVDPARVIEHAEQHPSKTLAGIAEDLGVAITTVRKHLQNAGVLEQRSKARKKEKP